MMNNMKKLVSNFIRYILVVAIFSLMFLEPCLVSAASKDNTLRGLRSEL